MKITGTKTLVVSALLTGLAPRIQAAVTEAWVQRYSNAVSNSADQAFKVVRDAANDIIVTGSTDDRVHGQDMLTIKYSGADGSVIWQNRYNGPENSNDYPTALAVDGSGNVVVTGVAPSYGYDYYTAKYAAANGALLWQNHSTNPVVALAVDGSGNVVVTGNSDNGTNTDYYTAKYAAADGTLLWERRYDGAVLRAGDNPYNSDDRAWAVAIDGSGNVVVTGASVGPGSISYDYYTAKYAAANGALLWERRYNGPSTGYRTDVPRAIAVDGNGNVVVTGISESSVTDFYHLYTAKYAAANGALLWEKRYIGPSNSGDGGHAVAVDASGNVVVTGYSDNARPDYDNDYYTVKYASTNGAVLWEKRSTNSVLALAVDSSGNVVLTGSSTRGVYAAANGALLWEIGDDGPTNSIGLANAVTVDASGNVVVTGSSGGDGSNGDYYTAKYAAANGALLWERRYDGPANGIDGANAVAVDGSGNVAVTGSSSTIKYLANGTGVWTSNSGATALAMDGGGNVLVAGFSGGDFYTAKYAATDGALLWEKRYVGDGAADSVTAAVLDPDSNVVVDSTGNVVASGRSIRWLGRPGFGSMIIHYYTAKYAAADGALIWEKRRGDPVNHSVYLDSVYLFAAVDGGGNVVVLGPSYNAANSGAYTTMYAGADGALLWEKSYNALSNIGYARAAVVDSNGNVLVAGNSFGTSGNNDYYTAKYAAADGALLWEKRYNGPANKEDIARAVAADGSGNVVVTGTSYNGSSQDYYTAKYAVANGALLWEKRYNSPANGQDIPNAVAVDGSGNVVVTGSSYNGINTDYYTAKYAVANGALLWEKRYNGPANENDDASSLALGPNGMVAITGSSSRDYATVVYRENLSPVTITLAPTGARLRFIGVPGRSYTIERSLAVTGPWSTIATPTAPIDGIIEYVDINPPSGTAFYRTSTP